MGLFVHLHGNTLYSPVSIPLLLYLYSNAASLARGLLKR